MYTIIVFLCTLAEISALAAGYLLHSQAIFINVAVYGSPFYMVMNLLNRNSPFFETNPIYIGFAVFHLIKYAAFCRSQATEDRNFLRSAAIFMEAAYLAIGGYYSM